MAHLAVFHPTVPGSHNGVCFSGHGYFIHCLGGFVFFLTKDHGGKCFKSGLQHTGRVNPWEVM